MTLLNPINSAFARHGWWVEEHAKALHDEYPIYTIRSSINGIGDYYRAGRVATTELQRDYVQMLEGDLLSATPSDSFFYETVTNELLTTGKSVLAGYGTLRVHTWTGRELRNLQDGSSYYAESNKYVRMTNNRNKYGSQDVAIHKIYSSDPSMQSVVKKALFVNKIKSRTDSGDTYRKNNFGRFQLMQYRNVNGTSPNHGYAAVVRFQSADGLEKKLGD